MGVARHFTEGLEMMRSLPGLNLLLVTFSAGIRADDLGRIGGNSGLRDKAEDRQRAAEEKHGRPERGHFPQCDRPKTMRSAGDNDFSPLHQPFHTAAPAVPTDRRGNRDRARPSAGWWAQRATPSRE